MEMNQIYQAVNAATQAAIGDSAVLNEDLSNIVDIGDAVFNANSLDKYVAKLVDHIGKVVFVNRPYQGDAPSVLRDGWEYGATLEKIASDMPEAVENDTWNLTDGQSYDPNVFKAPDVYAKFFNKRTTFEIDRSIADRQVKSGFSGPQQLDAFVSMLFNEVDKSATVKTSEMVRRTIVNFIAKTIDDIDTDGEATTTISTGTTKAVNLLTKYNTRYGTNLTADKAITDPDFIRFAVFTMNVYQARMKSMSKLFNIGKKARFTPADRLHLVMLADFKAAADVFLQSDTFHEQYTQLPNAETVPYWQGSGTDYGWSVTSGNTPVIGIDGINTQIEVARNNETGTVTKKQVQATGILAVMFDHDALGVMNPDRRVTTNYNPKAEFTNYFYKFDTQYFNDYNENFVVFYVA